MRIVFFVLSITLILAFPKYSKASHIVGGEMTYKCLGPGTSGNLRYEITLDIYQDCLNGSPQAIQEDDPAYFTVYTGQNTLVYYDDDARSSTTIKVPANFSNNCINNPPVTCLQKTTFKRVYNLPVNSSGYYVVYQRCCRNDDINNLRNPGEVGATYYCVIPPASGSDCNNSAVFRNYPPQIICINNPLVYDHSATDPDGDSLSYELCETYAGGSIDSVKPLIASPRPFPNVVYNNPYSVQNPMQGNPMIQVDADSGLLTGTPNQLGRFVVTVCCNEWRNGVMINTVKPEFQFVVTNCSKAVVANIPQYSDEFNTYIVNCKDFTVKFDNISSGGFNYHWDFGVEGAIDDTSSEFSPTYTYPDTGTYVVKLVVNKGSTCPDSIERYVKVYPKFSSNYYFGGKLCPNTPLQFTDSSAGSMFGPNAWSWDFGDGFTSTERDPLHNYLIGGDYYVKLISKNDKGCSDTSRRKVSIEKFVPFAGNDTIIVKGVSMQFNALGGGEYTWTPGTNLSSTNVGNPIGTYPDVGTFSYNVHIKSPFNQCEGDDSINVRVVQQAAIHVPSGFTPNGDGLNDLLRPFGVGYATINYFRVYNRWGEQVFYTTKFKEGWDGNWKGQAADVGVYFWVLSINNRFGDEELKKGDAVLIR